MWQAHLHPLHRTQTKRHLRDASPAKLMKVINQQPTYTRASSATAFHTAHGIACPKCIRRNTLPSLINPQHCTHGKTDPDTASAPRNAYTNAIAKKQLFKGYYRRNDGPAEYARLTTFNRPDWILNLEADGPIGPEQMLEPYGTTLGYDSENQPIYRTGTPFLPHDPFLRIFLMPDFNASDDEWFQP